MSPPPAHSYDALDTMALRQALGEFATGITVVTARGADNTLAGLTVNSFASVSLDPPLVLWSLGLGSPSLPVFQTCSHFAVNVLAADQQAISQRFAQSGIDKFADQSWKVGAGGTALLDGCNAWFECRVDARHEGGDHLILIGRIEQFRRDPKPPLVFHRGRYVALTAD
jgi:3-hydroxy-9,10-secoandrosta-1,3,5(10)-triene-9,17-dione monooxygenase reductase component